MKELENQIATQFINEKNGTNFYIEGIRFQCPQIITAALAGILTNFENTIAEQTTALKDLPAKEFTQLCHAGALKVSDQTQIVQLVETYLNHRKHLPLLDEENPLKDWSILTEDEKKARTEEEAKKKEEE